MDITLASGSTYRRELLAKLGLPFDCCSPDIDEAARPGEAAPDLVARLAAAKARAVIVQRPQSHLIVGSDQVACLDERILTKPGNHTAARRQLLNCSGREVLFHTGLALLNTRNDRLHLAVETTRVHFRDLSDDQIERYLQRDKPYDCAGSFRVEALGITLFRGIVGDDPNALVGLPLIRLVEFLAREGVVLP